jgi:hypothetical protein
MATLSIFIVTALMMWSLSGQISDIDEDVEEMNDDIHTPTINIAKASLNLKNKNFRYRILAAKSILRGQKLYKTNCINCHRDPNQKHKLKTNPTRLENNITIAVSEPTLLLKRTNSRWKLKIQTFNNSFTKEDKNDLEKYIIHLNFKTDIY